MFPELQVVCNLASDYGNYFKPIQEGLLNYSISIGTQSVGCIEELPPIDFNPNYDSNF